MNDDVDLASLRRERDELKAELEQRRQTIKDRETRDVRRRKRRRLTLAEKYFAAGVVLVLLATGALAAIILSTPVHQTQTLNAAPLALTVGNMTATQTNGTNVFTVKVVNSLATALPNVFVAVSAICSGGPTVALNQTTTSVANVCSTPLSTAKLTVPGSGSVVYTLTAEYTIPAAGSIVWTFQAEQ